jgi:AcrR family transcriptional regulator
MGFHHDRSSQLTAGLISSPIAVLEISLVGEKMSRTTERSREKILEAGFRLFFREGYARVSMEMIAAQAGMTKRTLYNHFDSKDQLLGAVLESQNRRSLARFKDWTANADGTIGDFLDQFFGKASTWVASARWRGPGFTRLAMELADRPGHPARKIAARHKAELERWMEAEFRARGSREPARDARTLNLVMEGAVALTLVSGNRDYVSHARQVALDQLSRKGD